jgi:hypothetical protein
MNRTVPLGKVYDVTVSVGPRGRSLFEPLEVTALFRYVDEMRHDV